MTGGYGSKFDPMVFDSDEHSSEGDTDDLTIKRPKVEALAPAADEEASTFKPPKMETSFTANGGEPSMFLPFNQFLNEEDVGGCADDDCFIIPPPVMAEEQQPPRASLTPQQQLVLKLVRDGKNVFYSGSGGTGKTFVLQHILQIFERRFWRDHSQEKAMGSGCECFACRVAITAPTGIAAIPIGGTTIHRATGIGIPHCSKDFNRMWHTPVKQKWRNLNVWIIDEISMVSAELLEYLEQIIRRIRTRAEDMPGKPFGGLQVIFAGDFFQLQPVQEKITHTSDDQFLNKGLAFEAPAWRRAELNTVILQRVFRQEDDTFVELLNGIRTGENPAALEEIFRRCSRHLPVADGILPTILYSKNVEVDKYNSDRLNELLEPKVVLIAEEDIITREGVKAEEEINPNVQRLQFNQLRDAEFWRHCTALKELSLKVGAQVMLLRNRTLEGNASDLVNGSRGVVVGWKGREEILEQCRAVLRKKHYPETSEEVEAKQTHEKLISTTFDPIPVVRFRNGCSINCVPERFSYRILNVGECVRWQVPLKLAWALTIHKCQGMTLDYVRATLTDIFAEGQVYVALSRVRSMQGLQVIGNYSRKDVRVSPKVVEFYRALAANEAPPVGRLEIRDMLLEVPEEEILNSRKASHIVQLDHPFEKCSEKALPDYVICYHCKKRGHPASECTMRSRNFLI